MSGVMNSQIPGLGLADAIELIRSELESASEKSKHSPIAFRAGPVDLEFEVVFDVSGGADAGVRVWVVSLGAKGEVSKTQTHRLKVSLQPIDRTTGDDARVKDVGER
jgi:hypothetical protein